MSDIRHMLSPEEREEYDARISGNAWVFDSARVYGDARISGDALISGNAWVSDSARVYGDARISGDARVHGNAWVFDSARVYGDARISDSARVSGDARVYGNARVHDSARVSGDAEVHGNAWVSSSARVLGDALISGNAWVFDSARVYGDARVHGNALISGNADLARSRHVLTLGPVGSGDRTVTIHRHYDGPSAAKWGHRINAGCWSGTLGELADRIAGDGHGWPAGLVDRCRADYRAVIVVARIRVAEWEAEPLTAADHERWAS